MNPQWSDEVKERYTKDQEFYAQCSARGIQIRLNTDTLELEGHMIRKPVGLTAPFKPVKEWEVKRPWVGLTNKEIEELSAYPMNPTADLVRAIEKLLKEKNT
jgi:hypothetical protein